MIGKKRGMFTIIKDTGKRTANRGNIYLCKCDCGNMKEVSQKVLKNEKKPRSCGCSRKIRQESIFHSNYEKTDGCWIWKGHIGTRGYGRIGIKRLAHRDAYQYAYGRIPIGMQVLHMCDNRKCVNPGHLFLGSIADNMRDKVGKNRQAKGSTIGSSVLNEEMVYEIRRKRLNGKTYKELMAETGVTFQMIRMICKNKQWKHVPLGKECSEYVSPHDSNQEQHAH